MYLLCCAKFYMADDMYIFLDGMMRVIKGTVSRVNQSRGESYNGGKSPLSLGVYKNVSDFGFSNKPDHIFFHCFLTLEWSLMVWDDNRVHSHVNHLE